MRTHQAIAFLVALLSLASTARAQTAEPAQPAPPPAPPPPSSSRDDDVAALREEVRALRAEVDAQKAASKPAPATPAPPPPRPLGYESYWPWILPPEGISSYAYLQAPVRDAPGLAGSADARAARCSTRTASRSGARASTVIGEWEYAAMALELDANTTNGPQVDLRKAEASLQYRPDRSQPPTGHGDAGPLRRALRLRARRVPAHALLHGAHAPVARLLPGGAGPRASPRGGRELLPLDDRRAERRAARRGVSLRGAGSEQCQGRLFRFGFDTTPLPDLQIAGGMSALRGTGFHAGHARRPGTSLQWHDINEDGVVQHERAGGRCRRRRHALAELRPVGRRRRSADELPLVARRHEGLRRVRLAQNLRPGSLRRRSRSRRARPARARLLRRGACRRSPAGRRRPPLRLLRPELERVRQARRQAHPLLGGDQDDLASGRRSCCRTGRG